MRIVLKAFIRFYRYGISPLLGPNCRFYPSCSGYAEEAIERHGAWRGVMLAARRLMRCHPWHAGGYDPVPLCGPLEPVPARPFSSEPASHEPHSHG